MSSIELDNAYERHEFLPLAVNWLGDWSPTTTYFKNDVVVSPINVASYIMVGPPTTIQGGDDPSINTTNWFQYGKSIDTVQNLWVGEGIEIAGTDTNPLVMNTGIVSIVPGAGFSNIGTAQDPVLACETLAAIVPDLGIDVFGLPIPNIVNTGVTYIRNNPGISLTYVNGIANIASTGLQSLAAVPTNAGLTVSAGPIKTITNTGILSVIHGTGIINDGTATEPELRNGGVVSVSPLNPSMTVVTSASQIKIGSNKPVKTLVWTPTITTQLTPNPVNGTIGTIPITQAPGLWADCLANGVPYSVGYFALTFPFTFYWSGFFQGQSTTLSLTLNDGVNNKKFQILYTINPRILTGSGTTRNQVYFTLGTRLINLETLRASGFRVLTSLQFQSGSGFPLELQSVGGPAYATFYPFIGIIPP